MACRFGTRGYIGHNGLCRCDIGNNGLCTGRGYAGNNGLCRGYVGNDGLCTGYIGFLLGNLLAESELVED